jgi:hypothetical protein
VIDDGPPSVWSGLLLAVVVVALFLAPTFARCAWRADSALVAVIWSYLAIQFAAGGAGAAWIAADLWDCDRS